MFFLTALISSIHFIVYTKTKDLYHSAKEWFIDNVLQINE